MKCRHCQTELLTPMLDLGTAPPSNAYLTGAQLKSAETWLPLRLLVCEHCWLVQTEDYAGREALFTDDYAYFSSYSSSWLSHAENYVAAMTARFGFGAQHCVVEIAANDGYLLQYVQQAKIPCYGVEPTASTAAAARAKGIEIFSDFFGTALARQLVTQSRQADLMVANNVLAHVPDLNDFVAGFRVLLKPNGVATFEFPHLLQMVQQHQFDTAYHEHYSYLSLTAVQRIFAANGLTVFDAEELSTHGGSLRVYAQRADTGQHVVSHAISLLLQKEDDAGMTSIAFYTAFQLQALKIKHEVLRFLLDCQQQGLKVAAYGAAAKGNTLLNFAGIRNDLLAYVVDKNPHKQGRYLPGSRIEIVNEEYLIADRPDIVLILPWNLKYELTQQLHYIRQWQGKFVTAIPALNVF